MSQEIKQTNWLVYIFATSDEWVEFTNEDGKIMSEYKNRFVFTWRLFTQKSKGTEEWNLFIKNLKKDSEIKGIFKTKPIHITITSVWDYGNTDPQNIISTDGGKEHKWMVFVDVYDTITPETVCVIVTGNDQFPSYGIHFVNAVRKEACGSLDKIISIKSWKMIE